MQSKVLFPVTALLLLVTVSAFAQTQPSQPAEQAAAPVFYSQSKLVIVNVVVTEKGGKVVQGLKPADFSIVDAGKPQKVRFFEEHTSVREAAPQQMPQLPPNQFTNFPLNPPKDTMNIVLFDLLNTPPTDQMNARNEMLKALEKLPRSQQMALFVLGDHLQMIQGPSGDTEALIKAAKSLLAQNNRVDTFVQSTGDNETFRSIEQQGGYGSYGTPADVEANLRLALFRESKAQTNDRVAFTLRCMVAISRMVSGFSGRKNLIWISGGIPFHIDANLKAGERWRTFTEKQEFALPLEQAGTLLADSQISIYPIDVSGLAVLGVGAAVSGKTFNSSGSDYSSALNDQTTNEWDNRQAMKDLADQTGGTSFFGSNDLAKSITQSVNRGERYYTLAYVPTDLKLDGSYHKIEIKTSRSGLDLQYRKGYLAIEQKIPNEQQSFRMMSSAMQLGMPQSTALLMRVQVMPPDKDHATARVDYAIAAEDVQFVPTAEKGKRATLDFMTVAWNSKGEPVESKMNSVDTNVHPNTPADALRTGIPGHLDLNLKPGKYVLCVGAMDRTTQKIGTVWLPITVTETGAPTGSK